MRPVRLCAPHTWLALRVLRRAGLLSHLNFTVRAHLLGNPIQVPLRGGIGMNLLMDQEPWMTPLLRSLLEHFPGTFVDVGVNVGQTLCKVLALDPQRAYVGFEPNPICANYARELVKSLGYADRVIIPAGLSDHDGIRTLRLHERRMDDTSATTVPDFRPGHHVHHRFTIPVVRFSTAARDLSIGQLGIVKIDVEGGEREVLLGAEERLRSDRPAVVLEILPVGERMARLPRQQEVEALFARLGYSLHRIVDTGHGIRVQAMNGPIGVVHDQELSNYLALPVERANEVLATIGSETGQQ